MHYQFAPWVTHSVAAREALIKIRERHPEDRVAVEFRHVSWYEPAALAQTTELLTELGAILVAVDAPQIGDATAPPMLQVTSRTAVVRFHGRNYQTWYGKHATSAGRFDYVYRESELQSWRRAVHAVAADVDEVHLLMNTNAGNQGPENAYLLAKVFDIELPPR